MRISDWSSDVCSSDLYSRFGQGAAASRSGRLRVEAFPWPPASRPAAHPRGRCCLFGRDRGLLARAQLKIARPDDLAARRERAHAGKRPTADPVDQDMPRFAGLETMFLAPLPERDEEDVEILALFGENITPAAAVAIGLRAEYVFLRSEERRVGTEGVRTGRTRW